MKSLWVSLVPLFLLGRDFCCSRGQTWHQFFWWTLLLLHSLKFTVSKLILRRSMASATELLSICTAKLTCILCFCHVICFFFSLLAKEKPSISWTAFKSSRKHHWIIFSSLSLCHWMVLKLPKRYHTSLVMWQTSNITYTWDPGASGCWNQVFISPTSRLHSRRVAVRWFVNAPSNTTPWTLIPSAWSKEI